MGVLFKNSDITIYNKYYNNYLDCELYQKTVIKEVGWNNKATSTVTNNGLMMADSVVVIVDKVANYISPKQFSRLTVDDMLNYFTFAMGDKIVKGLSDFEVTGITPFRIADLENNFDNVVNIVSVRELSDHWEVECK